MTSREIHYRSGYKYVLHRPAVFHLAAYPDLRGPQHGGGNTFIWLVNWRLLVAAGYAWDGASGPAIDTRTNMRASLAHDALYQLLRTGVLLPSARHSADFYYRDLCLADGMRPGRAALHLSALRQWGAGAAAPGGGRPVRTAP